jgi:hypothetical protein
VKTDMRKTSRTPGAAEPGAMQPAE